MSNGLASVEPEGPLYRLGRQPDPWAWPDWSYAAPDGTFGNRYDDPEGSYRVLYACSQRVGAFLETLARFRPDLEVFAELDRIEGGDEPSPIVPRTWLDGRLIGEATVEGHFVDVGDTTSLATLRTALAAAAIHHGLDEIDAATIRLRAPRAFTHRCRATSTSRALSPASATARGLVTTSSTGRFSSLAPTGEARSPARCPRRSRRTTPTCAQRSTWSA
jgi:hypothetical protein